MEYKKQVEIENYDLKYESNERWASYATQAIETMRFLEKSRGNNIIEVGVGSKTLSSILKSRKIKVTTVDIDPDLHPDYVASVTSLPFPDNSFDVAVAFEVLEHIKFEDVSQALSELIRVSKKGVVISIPNVYPYVSLQIKLPLLRTFSIVCTVPIKIKKDRFDGEHYWEIGRKNYPKKKFIDQINSIPGTLCTKNFRVTGCPFHHFFVIAKNNP